MNLLINLILFIFSWSSIFSCEVFGWLNELAIRPSPSKVYDKLRSLWNPYFSNSQIKQTCAVNLPVSISKRVILTYTNVYYLGHWTIVSSNLSWPGSYTSWRSELLSCWWGSSFTNRISIINGGISYHICSYFWFSIWFPISVCSGSRRLRCKPQRNTSPCMELRPMTFRVDVPILCLLSNPSICSLFISGPSSIKSCVVICIGNFLLIWYATVYLSCHFYFWLSSRPCSSKLATRLSIWSVTHISKWVYTFQRWWFIIESWLNIRVSWFTSQNLNCWHLFCFFNSSSWNNIFFLSLSRLFVLLFRIWSQRRWLKSRGPLVSSGWLSQESRPHTSEIIWCLAIPPNLIRLLIARPSSRFRWLL